MNAVVRTALVVLASFLLAGCATHRIDWQARVGVYTYDQAVTDYGPPDRYSKLSNGSMVAEWMLERGAVVTTPGPGPYYGPGYYYGPGWTGSSTTYFPGKFLRLTFSPDHKLTAWKEYSK